jgi:predicted enzyme related to lactoylglutathione lyase
MGSPVVHFDITGPNAEELQTFYSQLCGWKLTPLAPEMMYSLVDTQAGSGINGGIGAAPEGPGGVTFYAYSDDLQASLDKAVSLGGKVTQEVMAIPGVVALAMFADPAGNHIGLVGNPPGAEGQQAADPSPGNGAAIGWFEVMGPDPAALVSFYSELFGWTEKPYDIPGEMGNMKYSEMDTGNERGIHGGIGNNPMGATYVTVYAVSGDLAASVAKAEELGGKTIMPPTDIPGGPKVAMIADPQGHVFGFFSGMPA